MAALVLIGVSVAVGASAAAGADAARAVVTPIGTHVTAQDPSLLLPIPGSVRVSGASAVKASPEIYETACRNYNLNDVRIYENNSIGCVAFNGSGDATDLFITNVFEYTTGVWSGYIKYLYQGGVYQQDFQSGQVYYLPDTVDIIEVFIK
jgi:hypothetical protein